ncbi:MAG: rhodanese-like domain-containing protein [Gammaproteobacteria bacterium]|nr:rhodanese-like domain-containing protein [Gammaproteobacteria bacterium]
MFVRFISLSFLILVLAACSKEQLVTEKPAKQAMTQDNSLIIQLNQQVIADNLQIEFMQMSGDSRCAKGVQCAWAGNAQAIFLVTTDAAAQTLALNTHGGEKYPKSAIVAGYEITLEDIQPYPATNIKIDPSQYVAKISVKKSDKKVMGRVIIDVRTQEEYQAGHYPDAVNLNFETIDATIHSLDLPKDTQIYVYCRSGRRSGIAKTMLEEQGFTNVINGINQGELHKTLGTAPKM